MLDLLPSLAAILLIPLWVRLAKQFPVMWRFAFEGSFALCVVVYLHWLLRRRYTRHGWRALRDLGYAERVRALRLQPQPASAARRRVPRVR